MSTRVLIADDEPRLRRLVNDFLTKEGYEVTEACDGGQALDLFYNRSFDLVILDVMMPVLDGISVCKEMRGESDIPIIILTAKGEELDELTGFESGADEYISKPFSPKILVARVNALLKRASSESSASTICKGDIILDKDAHICTAGGQDIVLSVKEFELLQYFMINDGLALSREKILDNVWDYDYFGDARTVDTHVKKLRSKLGEYGKYINTIWGMGYKFEVK